MQSTEDRVFATSQTIQWIIDGLAQAKPFKSAVPGIFASYTEIPEIDAPDPSKLAEQERAIVQHLSDHGSNSWWLGYLETGAHDVVFNGANRVYLYSRWPYVMVRGNPAEALTLRDSLPDLMFPADRSWMASMLWDDSWTCVGGPRALIHALADDPATRAR